jgi:spore germination protein YaaH
MRSASTFPVRWGFYVTYAPDSLESLRANIGSLNCVSPSIFAINKAGQLAGNDQPEITSLVRQAGARNLPMVSNVPFHNDLTPILSNPATRSSIIDSIDSKIKLYGYDGITIDIEEVNPADGALITTFMGELSARLHPEGKLVVMAIPPKPQDTSTGFAAAYDYAALGNIVDYLLVMGYDYHIMGGQPGPIAPIESLQGAASYTVAHVPPSKVIWGIGVYGYDWPVDAAGHLTGQGARRTYAEAAALVQRPDAQSGYDSNAQSPWAFYMDATQRREIWYENQASFEAKLGLIRDEGMAGLGIWRLGQEDPGIWQALTR